MAPACVIVVAQAVFFPMPAGAYVLGVSLGMLGALVAIGMALIYRANRVLNLAQSDLGVVPAVVTVDLIAYSGLNVALALGVGLGAALLCGLVVEVLIIRRFARAPRLILMVATIGVSQLLLVIAAAVPSVFGDGDRSVRISLLDGVSFELAPVTVKSAHVVALLLAPVAMLAVGAFLRWTRVGLAVRASAERSDRAALLGIPVKRLNTTVWVIATVLSFVGVALRAGMLGLPALSQLSYLALLSALAAVMLGGLTDLPAVATSAVAIGVMEQAVTWNNGGRPGVFVLVLALMIVVGLLGRRVGTSRADRDTSSSWVAAETVRPVPAALRRLPEVRVLVVVGAAVVVGILVGLPIALSPGAQSRAAAMAIFALVGVSIIVLTGWAGQVSLGQFAFVALGSVVTAFATVHWRLDLALCIVLSAVAGAGAAVVVGLPALRVRGLFLAVTTLAFAAAVNTYLLSTKYFDWIPQDRFERIPLFGLIDLSSELSMYYLCLACLAATLFVVRGLRRSRTGRVLIAVRENEQALQGYGVNIVRVKLLAFALSGALAAFAGSLLVYLQQRYADQLYDPMQGINAFTSTVVGGLGSMMGAVFGSLWFNGATWFLKPPWSLLPSAIGVLLVLLLLPGGFGGFVVRQRDRCLRALARRRGMDDPW